MSTSKSIGWLRGSECPCRGATLAKLMQPTILTLLAETALTRWIAVKRRFHGTEAITLKTPAQSVDALRERMQTLVEAPGGKP